MVDIRVLDDRILVLAPEAPEERTSSGLIVPGSVQGNVAEAVVVKTGSGRITESGMTVYAQVQPGQRVLIYRQAGIAVQRGEQEYRVLAPNDVIAVVETED